MAMRTALAKNLEFWHWYPELLVRDLTPDQLARQPETHDTSIAFAIWHAYRAEDDILHGLLGIGPSVYASQGWAERLPVSETGVTPFGNGLSREQIGRLHFDCDTLLEYAKCVGERITSYLDRLSDDDAASQVSLPFFADVYPMLTSM